MKIVFGNIEGIAIVLKTLFNELFQDKWGTGFGSISLTLQHMSQGQNFWFAIVTYGQSKETNPRPAADPDAVNKLFPPGRHRYLHAAHVLGNFIERR